MKKTTTKARPRSRSSVIEALSARVGIQADYVEGVSVYGDEPVGTTAEVRAWLALADRWEAVTGRKTKWAVTAAGHLTVDLGSTRGAMPVHDAVATARLLLPVLEAELAA